MNQDHIIEKIFVEVTVNSKQKALSIQEDINSFLSIDVFPEIEKYINALEYKLGNKTLQIPRLELNLDVNSSSLNIELKDKIAQVFQEELSEVMKPIENLDQDIERDSKAYFIDNQEKTIHTFIYFLEKGNMPWWNSETKGTSFLESKVFKTLILSKNFPGRIATILPEKNVQERIINQLSDEQIAQLCISVLTNKELKINLNDEVIQSILKLNPTERQIVWRLVLSILSEYLYTKNINLREFVLQKIIRTELFPAGLLPQKKNDQHLKTIIHIFPFVKENEIIEILRKKSEQKSENTEISNETIQQKNEKTDEILSYNSEDLSQDDEQYIKNAGLILIHPFIKPFFEHCDLLHPETQQLTDPELGAHLLHYIATGKTNAPEYEMVFEKFLCNIPMHQSINRHIKLSRKHKAHAKNVIESVQHNWNPMKKSSVALLQNEFFQRSGKLVVSDHDYMLTVEQKTQDILLEKLNWGLGLVKLSWKDKFLFVKW
ncbi:contractile injection system tape measure protein [Chryseobacterium sp. 2TAF14]|uniref:contractile injection system tape measure protein n=1 Tax=Chryseobacterium sp. 2TAF14 TaxID=3233007 RepID=UPI003F918633